MRKLRLLKQDVWYEVRTAINNREPLFCRQEAVKVFCQVFGEARERFVFELRGFRLDGERLSFYIRPAEAATKPLVSNPLLKAFVKPGETCNRRILNFYEENVRDLPIKNRSPHGHEVLAASRHGTGAIFFSGQNGKV